MITVKKIVSLGFFVVIAVGLVYFAVFRSHPPEQESKNLSTKQDNQGLKMPPTSSELPKQQQRLLVQQDVQNRNNIHEIRNAIAQQYNIPLALVPMQVETIPSKKTNELSSKEQKLSKAFESLKKLAASVNTPNTTHLKHSPAEVRQLLQASTTKNNANPITLETLPLVAKTNLENYSRQEKEFKEQERVLEVSGHRGDPFNQVLSQ